MRRNRWVLIISAVVGVLLGAAGSAWALRYSDSPIRGDVSRPFNAGPPGEQPHPTDGLVPAELPAPVDRQQADDGVAVAARQFARQLVPPRLKFPESAEFPEDSTRLQPFTIMNETTGPVYEHWSVDGVVESRNQYGIPIRSAWRAMVGRTNDRFFLVFASLEGQPIYQMTGHAHLLQAARQAYQERLTAAEQSRKQRQLAADRAAWRASAAAKPEEQKAREMLKLAEMLLRAGRREPAHRRLLEVINQYPYSQAAVEAELLLGK
ncbi:MAG: hypothetical protein JSS02_19445 [Planctomycetes bacterium]|nr:hypothetical protein [Planctomycetota bacterium]